MKALAIIILISISAMSIAQDELNTGCYSNCTNSGMSSHYVIQFNDDSTFIYSKRTGLSVDDAIGVFSVKNNLVKLEFEPNTPDSAYFTFTDSLNQLDSVLVQMPSSSVLMKRPSQLYLVKKKLFLYAPKNNREARRSKFSLVRR